jgi:manganese/zinc/iron transport system permease protein
MNISEFIAIDLPALLACSFVAITCALVGNYLVLRKLSLMGDAISHSVLPGIVIAFLISGSRASWPVFIGAVLAGAVSAILIELVKKLGRVEPGAAMGVIFSIFFALGVILIEQAAARSVDLDADCLLHGQLESIFWSPPSEFSLSSLWLLPDEIWSSFIVLICVSSFVLIFYKELKISSFDPALATSLGFKSSLINILLMIVVACCVVASFKIVGSILVIALLICPAACARLLTSSLNTQLILSLVIAELACLLGYFFAAFGPQLFFNYPHSVSTAGMITVVLGLSLIGSIIISNLKSVRESSVLRK